VLSPTRVGKDADAAMGTPGNAQTSPDGSFSMDGRGSRIALLLVGSTHDQTDPAERFMWPRFLSRLRETFSLDSDSAPEEQEIAVIQAVRLTRCRKKGHLVCKLLTFLSANLTGADLTAR
jgi:hypothetical protein